EWLKLHNPSIDWAKSTLKFDRCPVCCGPLGGWEDPESDDPELKDPELKEGDHLRRRNPNPSRKRCLVNTMTSRTCLTKRASTRCRLIGLGTMSLNYCPMPRI
ncbi:hypothetical protein B0H17DRAFT_1290066, partial [Mycena rosella]